MALETQQRYTVVKAKSLESLIKQVNELCEENWEVHGDMVVRVSPNLSVPDIFYQPMKCRVMCSRPNCKMNIE